MLRLNRNDTIGARSIAPRVSVSGWGNYGLESYRLYTVWCSTKFALSQQQPQVSRGAMLRASDYDRRMPAKQIVLPTAENRAGCRREFGEPNGIVNGRQQNFSAVTARTVGKKLLLIFEPF